MISRKREITSHFRVAFGITFTMLTGCTNTGSGTVKPGLPTKTLSPSDHAPSWQTLVDAPDACSLIDVKQIPQLKRLIDTKGKKESSDRKNACTWQDEDSQGVSILRVSTFDFRSDIELPTPRNYSLDCPPYEGNLISIRNKKFCLDSDRHGITIMHHNIKIAIIWTTTEISRTQPEAERVKQENRVSRQLADQAFQHLGM